MDTSVRWVCPTTKEAFTNSRGLLIPTNRCGQCTHVVSLNEYPEEFVVKTLSYLLKPNSFIGIPAMDRWHLGYSIAKGFATLRISKKDKADDFQFVYWNKGDGYISRPHFYFFKTFFGGDMPDKDIWKWFDRGIFFVGYIMDKERE